MIGTMPSESVEPKNNIHDPYQAGSQEPTVGVIKKTEKEKEYTR
jgi:hypothetical protein